MESGQGTQSYYSVLGVSSGSPIDEIRRAYRKLAMKWHPDKWTKSPSLLGEAKRKFQKIQEAYSVLSDERKRTMYDAGLYDPDEEEDERFCDFLQEMASLMADVPSEEKNCSIEDLQKMFVEMVEGFGSPQTQWYCGPSVMNGPGRAKRARWDTQLVNTSPSCHF